MATSTPMCFLRVFCDNVVFFFFLFFFFQICIKYGKVYTDVYIDVILLLSFIIVFGLIL